jgi:hypothetical protein
VQAIAPLDALGGSRCGASSRFSTTSFVGY